VWWRTHCSSRHPAITAADCARVFFTGWISRFGVLATITCHRKAQFTSALWAALCSLLDITHHIPITAYQQQSNGLVEKFHTPQAVEGRPEVQGRRRRLAQSSPVGDVGFRATFQDDGVLFSR
jgi:hypothetical protein